MAILVKIRVDDRGNVAIEKLGKNAKHATKEIGDLGSVIGKVFGVAGAFFGLWQLIEGLKQAISEANRFQDQMTKLQVITGVNNREFSNLSKKFRDLSLNTEHSATSISKAALELSKMGFEGSKLEKILPNALDLATYAGEDLTFTAVNLGRVLNAFGKDADQSANVANVMGRVLNLTALDFKDFIEAMSYTAPVAKNLGYEFEETAAMIGLLSNRSIIGSRAGTGLKDSMLRLLAPTEASAKALKKSATEGGSLVQKFEAMKGAGFDVADMLEQFRMIALPAALTMKDNTDEAAKLTRELMNMGFSVEEASEKIREMSNIAQWKEVWNSIVNVGIALNEAFGDNQRTLAQNLKEEFIELAELVKRNESDIKDFGSAVVKGAKAMAGLSNFVIQNGPTIAAIFATLWGAGKINDIIRFFKIMASGKGVLLKLKGPAEVLAQGMGTLLGKVNLIAIAFEVALGAMNLYFDSLDKRMDKQQKRVADGYLAPERISDLKNLKELGERARAEGFWAENGEKPEYDRSGNILDSHSDYIRALKAYKDKYGTDEGGFQGIKNALINIEKRQNPTQTPPSSPPSKEGKLKITKEHREKAAKAGLFGLLNLGDRYDVYKRTGKDKSGKGYTYDRSSKKEIYLPTGDDVDLSGVDKAIDDQKRKPEDDVKDFFEAEAAREKINADAAKEDADAAEQRKQNIQKVFEFTTDTMLQTLDVISQFQEMKLQEDLLRLEKEKQAIADRYATEERLAGNNVFKKALLAKKFANDQKKIDDEMERKRDEAARKSKTVAIFEAIIQGAVAVVNAINAGVSIGGPFAPAIGAAFGAVTAGLVAAQIGIIAATNFRSGGRVYGEGNGTSDSVIASVSRGEYIVDSDTVRKLGGFEALESMLDRGSNSERSINLYVDNYIGSKEYTRELIEQLREELSR